MFGDDELFGPDEGGNFYYNQVEYATNPGGLDDFVVRDTCGRSIPLPITAVPDLMRVLPHLYTLYMSTKAAETITEFMESDVEGYVDASEIKYDSESFQGTVSWPFGQ
jgi:hypothetical protein